MLIPIVIYKESDSTYGVVVPDVPGCYVAEDTFEKAILSAKIAIEFHLETLVEEGMEVPILADFEEHKNNPDYADGIWTLVDIDSTKLSGKAKRVNVMIPENVLNQIDTAAKRSGLSRSRFLTVAALDKITYGSNPLPPKSRARASKQT